MGDSLSYLDNLLVLIILFLFCCEKSCLSLLLYLVNVMLAHLEARF